MPDQSVKHFNRYEGMNESEMSLGYVKKKADTRAGKTIEQAPVEEPVNVIETQAPKLNSTIDNFIKDETRTEATIGEIFGDSSQNIADVKDVTVRKMTFDNTPVLHIKTAESHLIEGGTIYRVTAQGDKNHLDFVNYLLKKEQDKTQEIIAKTGIDKK